MPPSRRASSSHRSSPSHRSSSSHRSSPSRRSSSSHRSSSSYRSSSYSHRSSHHSYGSSSGGLFGALFGLNRANSSSTGSSGGTYRTDAFPPPMQREYFCKYCDTKSVITPTSGVSLVCPVCGAPVSQTDLDALYDDAYEDLLAYRASTLPSGSSSRRSSSIGPKILFYTVLIIIMAYVMLPGLFGRQSSSGNTSSYSKSVGDSIYVPALSRSVDWSDEYNSYYDEPTDCYFFYNEDINPKDWQYWYEGISSGYGEYGWMEWDEKQNRWYINTEDDVWEPLPAKYYTERLWHF